MCSLCVQRMKVPASSLTVTWLLQDSNAHHPEHHRSQGKKADSEGCHHLEVASFVVQGPGVVGVDEDFAAGDARKACDRRQTLVT